MGWWQDIKANRVLTDARKDVARARSPYTVSQFIDKCIELKQFEVALEEAKKGFQEFPDSEALRNTYKQLIKVQCEEDLKQYREELRRGPNTQTHYNLARLYKEMGDYDQAVEYSRQGAALFPDFEGNYIILGDIRYERFQRDLRAADGLEAVALFEKASDLNRENYRLLIQLIEIYLAVGAKKLAVLRTRQILEFAPDDARVQKLSEQAERMKKQTAVGLKEVFDEFEERARKNSAASGFRPNAGTLARRYQKNPDHLARKLRTLDRVDGFVRAIVLGPSLELLAAHPGGPGENRPIAAHLKEILQAARECSLRMDISTFENALFDQKKGCVYLASFDCLALALLCTSSAKEPKLKAEVFKFVEHELYL